MADDKAAESHGKGKGKQPENDTDTPKSQESLASRISASATYLTAGLVPKGSAVNEAAQAIAAPKAESSRPARHSREDAFSSRQPFGGSETTGGLGAETFRSKDLQNHVVQQEAAFSDFLEGTQVFEAGGTDGHPSHEDGRLPVTTIPGSQMGDVDECTEYTEQDGAAVVSLLNGTIAEAEDELDPEASPDVEQRAALQCALFGDNHDRVGRLSGGHADELLDFVPDYITIGAGRSEDLLRHFGVTDPAEARTMWVDQWQSVLSDYTDEVWGDLGPLVQEAKQELRVLKAEPQAYPPADLKALKRLRQLLAHLRPQ